MKDKIGINKDLVIKKYQEMKEKGLEEGPLSENLKGVFVFINKKPSISLSSIKVDSDVVYVGSK